jgi:hypothetical protein
MLKHEMITDVPICFVENKIDTSDDCQNVSVFQTDSLQPQNNKILKSMKLGDLENP